MYIAKRKTVRVGILGLLREVFQVSHPQLEPPPPTVLKTYRRTIDEILADTTILGPTGCLEYNHKGSSGGRIHPITGYGQVIWHGKNWYVHRLVALYTQVKHPGWRAWLAAQRWIHVCHTCDNPGCINADHLVIATAQWNTWDAIGKGRFRDRGKTIAQLHQLMLQEAEVAVTEAEQLATI